LWTGRRPRARRKSRSTITPHIWEEPRFQNTDVRPITHWGLQQAEIGPIAAPGKYTVTLTLGGQGYTEPLEVRRNPDSLGTESELESSVRLQLKVRDDITAVSDMTNQIEWMRKQLEDEHKTVTGRADLIKLMDTIDTQLKDVEYRLITRADALSDDKYFQESYNLYQNFIWLNGEIGTGAGDVAGSGDWGQTETAIGLVLDLERQLQVVKGQYKTVMDKDIPAYNAQIRNSGLKPLETTGAPLPPVRQGGRGGGGQ